MALPKLRHEGWLSLKGKTTNLLGKHTWNKRYCILDPDLFQISVYKSEQDAFMMVDAAQEIDLQQLRGLKMIVEKKGKGKRIDLVDNTGEEHALQADSAADATIWHDRIAPYYDAANAAMDPSLSKMGTRHQPSQSVSVALGGGAPALPAAPAPPPPQQPALPTIPQEPDTDEKGPPLPPKQVVKIAVVGTGWGTRVQIPAFTAAGMTVGGVWARSKEKANVVCKAFRIPFGTASLEELLEQKDIDIVCISTPPVTHCGFLKAVLASGKHAICEKPTAVTVEQAEEMAAMAAGRPEQLCIMDHELRFLPSVARMRNLVLMGRLGKLLQVRARVTTGSRLHDQGWNWWSEKSKLGGVLGAIGSHVIDLLSFVMGSQIKRVHGIVQTFVPKRFEEASKEYRPVTSDDHVSTHVQFDNGVYGHFICSVVTAGDSEHYFSVGGTKGTLSIIRNRLIFFGDGTTSDRRGRLVLEDPLLKERGLDNVWGTGTCRMAKAIGEALLKKKAGAADALSELVKPRIPGQPSPDGNGVVKPEDFSPHPATMADGLYVSKVMEAIHRSSETGAWADI